MKCCKYQPRPLHKHHQNGETPFWVTRNAAPLPLTPLLDPQLWVLGAREGPYLVVVLLVAAEPLMVPMEKQALSG